MPKRIFTAILPLFAQKGLNFTRIGQMLDQ